MLQQVAGAIQQAHRDEQPALAQHWLAMLLSLLRIYHYEHAEQIELEAQTQVIDLHETLLPLAEAQEEAALLAELRESCSWALNTLGNHYAQQDEHVQAVETYTSAIAYAPQTAMLYRNRAGEYLELRQYDATRQDVEQAAQLEPEAARLPELWCDLYLGLGDGAAMLPYTQQLLAASPDEASHYYYLALAHALTGDLPAASAAMTTCSQTCSDDQREQRLRTLAQLQAQHPSLAIAWQDLTAILQDKSNPMEEVMNDEKKEAPKYVVHQAKQSAIGDYANVNNYISAQEAAADPGIAELKTLFEEVNRRLAALEEADRDLVAPAVEQTVAAATAIQQGDESAEKQSFLEARLKTLYLMRKEIGEVIITTLTSPTAGVALTLQKIGQKVKEAVDKGEG